VTGHREDVPGPAWRRNSISSLGGANRSLQGQSAHTANALTPDFAREQWSELVPPQPHGFVADVDAALEQRILNIALWPIDDRQAFAVRNPVECLSAHKTLIFAGVEELRIVEDDEIVSRGVGDDHQM